MRLNFKAAKAARKTLHDAAAKRYMLRRKMFRAAAAKRCMLQLQIGACALELQMLQLRAAAAKQCMRAGAADVAIACCRSSEDSSVKRLHAAPMNMELCAAAPKRCVLCTAANRSCCSCKTVNVAAAKRCTRVLQLQNVVCWSNCCKAR